MGSREALINVDKASPGLFIKPRAARGVSVEELQLGTYDFRTHSPLRNAALRLIRVLRVARGFKKLLLRRFATYGGTSLRS